MQKINFYEALQQQQLHPYFQPIVTLATGKSAGWKCASAGKVTPENH